MMDDAGPTGLVSRRDVGRLLLGGAVGAIFAAGGPGEAQETQPEPEPEVDPRVARIEERIGRHLSDERREALAQGLTWDEQAWSGDRAYLLPDGTEPGFVFRPVEPGGHGGGDV